MKISRKNPFLILAFLVSTAISGSAADLYWDGGAITIATDGNGASTYTGGTWSTAIGNWDQGVAAHAAWNNANLDTAIFAGTYASGTKAVALGSSVTVNQIKILTGDSASPTSANRYDIGVTSDATNNITFGGTYSPSFPAIDASGQYVRNSQFSAWITGTITGGLVVAHGSDGGNTSSGRINFTNLKNDFVGDVTIIAGNIHIASSLGNAANKLVLNGGSLFASGTSAAPTVFARGIVVATASRINFNATGVYLLDLQGAITGSANLQRISATNVGGDLKFSGDMSGFSGTIDNAGVGTMTVQSTATSGGAWKLSSTGILKLNTTDDTHIADGAGKSDLLMNGGTLDMNGKSETINGLSGATGTVQNQAVSTDSVLTLGNADATAIFGGTIRDNSGTGGTLSLKKTGSGTQSLGGTNSLSGATTVEAGTLTLSGTMVNSPVTVKNAAVFHITGLAKTMQAISLESGAKLTAPVDLTGYDYLLVTDTISLPSGEITISPIFAGAPEVGTFDIALATVGITGAPTIVTDFSSNGASRISGHAFVSGNALQVTIDSVGANLIWNDAAASGLWDLNTSVNFAKGAGNDVFKNYDHVTFDNSSPAGAIAIVGALQPSSMTVDSTNDFSFSGSGSITGGATLHKAGDGTLTIGNSNSYTGETVVTQGTLVVNGALGNTVMAVDVGATLAGSGTIVGAVNVDGIVAPGNGVGTLATGGLGLFGSYECDVDGKFSDKIAVTGNLTLSDAVLAMNFINPSTAVNHVVASYTGTRSGAFAAAPVGFELDYTEPGKVVLWPVTTPAAGTITMETAQGYPTPGLLAGVSTDPAGAAFSGADGWSLSSLGGAAGNTHATNSSGEYRGGQAIGSATAGTYIGGRLGGIQYTGAASISFDALYFTGTSVGFMSDKDSDGLFDGSTDAGMVFGFGGSPGRIGYRNAAFGTETFNNAVVAAGQWCHFTVDIGPSVSGSRTITMAVRNLTTGTDIDLDSVTPGIQSWTFTVTDAQFGTAPELCDGIFIRATSSARLDNILVTSSVPPATGYSTWADSWTSPALSDKTSGGDPDNDGITNLMEYVIGGDPRVSSTQFLPTHQTVGSDLVLSFKRSDESENDTTLKGQWSADLVNWTDVTPALVNENGSSPDDMTVTIPTANAVGGKLFGRISVKQN